MPELFSMIHAVPGFFVADVEVDMTLPEVRSRCETELRALGVVGRYGDRSAFERKHGEVVINMNVRKYWAAQSYLIG